MEMELVVIAGPACAETLAAGAERRIREMTGNTDFTLTRCQMTDFADGHRKVKIGRNIRGADVYIIQPTNPPDVNHMTLLKMLQAAALASAAKITAAIPYHDGLRQDTKDEPRVDVAAALYAQQIEEAMVACPYRHVMVLHPHFKQLHCVYRIPCDVLYPTAHFISEGGKLVAGDFSNVAPLATDAGSAALAAHYRKRTKAPTYAVSDKKRTDCDTVVINGILGDVRGRVVFIYDDIGDTLGSLKAVSLKAEELGAIDQYAFITHGILAGRALDNIRESRIKRLFITDSVRHPDGALPDDLITVVSVGELIGEAIVRNHTGGSIHAMDGMFDEDSSKA